MRKSIALLGCLALLSAPALSSAAFAQTGASGTSATGASGTSATGAGTTTNPTGTGPGYMNDSVSPGTGIPMGTPNRQNSIDSYNKGQNPDTPNGASSNGAQQHHRRYGTDNSINNNTDPNTSNYSPGYNPGSGN